jgi:hypothetical protein
MPTKGTKYYYAHREQCLENRRKYAEANREKIKEHAAEYYQKVLKQRRKIDRMYAKADLPPPPRKEPKPPSPIKTTKTFLAAAPVPKNPRKPRAPKKHPDISTLADMTVSVPSMGVQFLPGVTLDWNKL